MAALINAQVGFTLISANKSVAQLLREPINASRNAGEDPWVPPQEMEALHYSGVIGCPYQLLGKVDTFAPWEPFWRFWDHAGALRADLGRLGAL